MTQFSVLVLTTLVGAGVTGAAVVLSQDAGDAVFGSVGAQATISSEAALAWQALRRPRRMEPVSQEQAVVRPGSIQPSQPVPSASPEDAVSLARALQRELKRAGCYHGEINGNWNNSTRQAMKTFIDIANAKLPVTNPDPVLLALMQGDQHMGCAERCLRDGKADACREDRTAAAPPGPTDTVTTNQASTATFFEPPMALAGPRTSEADVTTPATQETVKKQNKSRTGDRPARTEDWTAKLWRDSTN